MIIKGELKRIKRVHVPPPDDGVHITGKGGDIKGTHSVWIGDKLVPKGQVSMYWQIDDRTGIKLYYGLNWKKVIGKDWVRRDFKKMQKLWKAGICMEPYKIEKAQLDIHADGKHIKKEVHGIVMQHVNYPKDAWEKFAQGYPYDWSVLDQTEHPDHNPAGFLAFQKKIKKHTGKSMKLGDVVYCQFAKRWFKVDVGD